MKSFFLIALALSFWLRAAAEPQGLGFEPNSPGLSSQAAGPVSLSGKVVLSDGTPLSALVPIQLDCTGDPQVAGYTDARGNFRLDFAWDSTGKPANGTTTYFRSDNPPETIHERNLGNCELHAWLPGFRSDKISLFNRRVMDNPDLGTIVLHRVGNVDGFTISATSALAPKDARRAYEKGLVDLAHSKLEQARRGFEKAVEIYPKHAAAWFELGRLWERSDHTEEARGAYARALAADPKYISPYERLSILAFKAANWREVADTTVRVLHLNPFDFPDAYYFHAVASLQLNQLDVAEKSAREAVRLDPAQHNPRALWLLGLVLAQKRNFVESAEYLRAFLVAAPNVPEAAGARTQLGIVEKLAPAMGFR